MKKNYDWFSYIIIFFLLAFPIIDILTASGLFMNNFYLSSVGKVNKGIFLTIISLYLLIFYKNKKIFIPGIIYLVVNLVMMYLFSSNNILTELVNMIEIFYLPILILFFNNFKSKHINEKVVFIVYFIYLNLLIIPYFLGIGHNISELYLNKNGYIGFYYSGNEISAIILGLLPVVIHYFKTLKIKLLKILVLGEVVIAAIILGTKTLLLGILIVSIYYLIKLFIDNKEKLKVKHFLISGIIIGIFTIGTIFVLPKTTVYKNFKTTIKYYEITKVKDLVSIKNIDHVIYSDRLTFLKNINKEYVNSSLTSKFFGIGRTTILGIKDIEIDIFDIFYSIGIMGFIVYLFYLYQGIKKLPKKDYLFSFILFLSISLFSGHVLFKPSVATFMALLFILSNNLDNKQKKILLVSNMYPSRKNKHYGSFVKNTYELLKNNAFMMEKVVIKKHQNKLIKLISYGYLHARVIIKGIFNNYDYIYVHFVSHASLGAVIAKKMNKKTKLVLNCHGNDIIPDTDADLKNVERSKSYLSFADYVIVPSNYFKKELINNYQIKENIITVYPSAGVNTDIFKNISESEAKKKVNLDSKYDYIGYVSRFEKNKGYDTFILMVNNLKQRKKINKLRFIMIGTGSEEKNVIDLINKYQLNDYIEVRNMVNQSELVNIYNSLKIFVFPTYRKSESLGLVGLEAMSTETLVIASDHYGPTDYIKDGKNGFFFKMDDNKSLTDTVLKVLKLEEKEVSKIKKNARESALKYDTKNTSDIILKIFK